MHHENIVIMLIAMFRSLFSEEYRAQQLIADLADDDLEAAAEAAESLGEMGLAVAVGPLIEALAMTAHEQSLTDDPQTLAALVDMRQDIVRALGNIGDDRAVGPLIALRDDDTEDRGVRYEAAHALRCLQERK